MLRLYVPVAVTVVLIATMTIWASIYSDRFSDTSVTAKEFGKRFEKLPTTVGNWEGEDTEVGAETLEVAGAVNHVSRVYRNAETGDVVDLWLVVGHARDIGRHTPDICYPSQGMGQDGAKKTHRIDVAGEPPANFFTARFRHETLGGATRRVFWAWNANTPDELEWVAPENQRRHFGNNTALYKMYFTSSMKDRDEPINDNVAVNFAKTMIPVVNRTLFPERYAAGDSAAGTPAVAPETAGDAAESAPAAK